MNSIEALQYEATTQSKILVAMSGGVDSSVAALLLQRAGFDIIGVSMQVWDYRQKGGSASRATCCSPDDFCDARRVAASIDIPYYVFDFERTFKREVIDKFVESYTRGVTPNPCVDCNNRVKFRELRERAAALGFKSVATGHYARVLSTPQGYRLLRGVDRDKDQSYFLYGTKREELRDTVFPVGDLTKDQVRAIAREAGLATAAKPESQDICFVSGSVADFIVQLGGKRKAGEIVDKDGAKLGAHDGIENFTVGQRRGLRIGGHQDPLYVVELDSASNRVVVGPRSALEKEFFEVGELNWISPDLPDDLNGLRCRAQMRHRHAGVEVSLSCPEPGTVRAEFVGDWAAVTPGQAAVFYDMSNEEVLGGGTITNC